MDRPTSDAVDAAFLALITSLVDDPDVDWSIGSFGAIGEFVRDADGR